jgi:inner membrane protein
MDNLTHTLTAIAISQTGLNRKTRFATLTLILAGNAPDIDVVSSFKGSLTYLKYHRGISHSFVGIIVLAVLIWAIMCWVDGKVKPKPGLPLNRRWLLLAALLGTGSHLLLDFTNAYGVRPFLPFSGKWYAWDIMFIFDPFLLAILILGMALPWLLRLVAEEVGSRKAGLVPGAIFCLVAMVALWGVRDFAHRRALSMLDSRTYSGEVPQRFSALPVVANPFTWTGVVETDSAFHVIRVKALGASGEPEELGTFEKPQSSPALEAAMNTRGGKILLGFARFPWEQVNEGEDSYEVRLSDLRFFNGSAQSPGFTLQVDLDKNLRTRSENFYFAGPGRK